MSLPLGRVRTGERYGWRGAGAVLLVVLALGIVARPAPAADADPYAATVTVDATADTVIKAREMARLDGQRRALAALVERLSGGAPVRLPKLDDDAITDLVTSFEVANERMSAVRYVADYTFNFRAAGIQRLMSNAGIAVAAPPAKPVTVIPVYQVGATSTLWEDPNPWRDAWQNLPAAAGPVPLVVPLVVPLGDVGDIAAIDAEKARAGDAAGIAAIAQRNGGGDAVVALAAIRGPGEGSAGVPAGVPAGVDVTVWRYHDGQRVATHAVPLDANPGESVPDLLRRAAAATVAGIESGWRKGVPAGYDQRGTLTAILPITGLDDWVRARQRLAAVPTIRSIALVALSRQEATIEIGYVGSIDQLKTSLAGIDLALTPGGATWRLARSNPDRVP